MTTIPLLSTTTLTSSTYPAESNLLIPILFHGSLVFQLENLATGAAILTYPDSPQGSLNYCQSQIPRPTGDGSWPPFHTAFGAPGGHHFGGCGQTGLRRRSLEPALMVGPCWTLLKAQELGPVRQLGLVKTCRTFLFTMILDSETCDTPEYVYHLVLGSSVVCMRSYACVCAHV